MICAAFQVFREALRELRNKLRFAVYRQKQFKKGVIIDPRSSIFAVQGITMGRGTTVFSGATVCATFFSTSNNLRSRPNGRIVIGENCQIHKGAIIITYGGVIELGDNVSINPYTILYGHGGLHIGEATRIASHCTFIPANHIFADPNTPIMQQGESRRGITIGHDVWVGTGVTVLDGVTVGDGTVLAAGCVVTKNIAPGVVVAGVPARQISSRY